MPLNSKLGDEKVVDETSVPPFLFEMSSDQFTALSREEIEKAMEVYSYGRRPFSWISKTNQQKWASFLSETAIRRRQ